MNITVKSKYIVFPINTMSTKKQLSFKIGNETKYKLQLKIDYYNPDFYAYIDVSRFMGKTLELLVVPEIPIEYRETDEMDINNLYKEPMRPQVHFSTKNGWINDPNGLVYNNGFYHMFYQTNPAEPNWENMHWGHSVSTDLIHWEEKPIALFPDERGAMFSGSAIVDHQNILGKNTAENEAVALFYTTTEPFCQYVSFSTDGFKTIEHFKEKPVVPSITNENRDPKVVFCEELDAYIMALFLNADIYCLLKSKNLIDWEQVQKFSLQGDSECPDIFPIIDSNSEKKWVFMGANDRYIVGVFEEGKFKQIQEPASLHYGLDAYAGQTFSNMPDNRVVRIVWDRWNLPTYSFKGQMGIPMELGLDKKGERYYLSAKPVSELKTIYDSTQSFSDVLVSRDNIFTLELKKSAYSINVKGDITGETVVKMSVFGRKLKLDFSKNEIRIGDDTAPICIVGGSLDLTVVVDKCSFELFMDNGYAYMTVVKECAVPDYNVAQLEISASNDFIVSNITVNSLKSIWGCEI